MSIDYKAVFSRVVYEEMCNTFLAHGIDEIHEEDFEDIVDECTKKCYWQSIGEFRRVTGQSVVSRDGSPVWLRNNNIGGLT